MPDDDEQRLFASLYPCLCCFAAVVGAVDVEPDDLVQEAVARYWLPARRSTPRPNPGGYLRTSIVHLAVESSTSLRRRDGAFARVTSDLRNPLSVDIYPLDLNQAAPDESS